jgi:NAD(P)-dependent dehydrogenase (short-subunit alcohol dehydrogenase family)
MELNGTTAIVSGGASGLGEATARELAKTGGHPLRVAVSCAGIAWAARTVGRDGTPHDLGAYQKVIAVNLIGTFNLMRLSAAAMAATEPAGADGQRGVIINTSSVAGIEGQTGQVAYSGELPQRGAKRSGGSRGSSPWASTARSEGSGGSSPRANTANTPL